MADNELTIKIQQDKEQLQQQSTELRQRIEKGDWKSDQVGYGKAAAALNTFDNELKKANPKISVLTHSLETVIKKLEALYTKEGSHTQKVLDERANIKQNLLNSGHKLGGMSRGITTNDKGERTITVGKAKSFYPSIINRLRAKGAIADDQYSQLKSYKQFSELASNPSALESDPKLKSAFTKINQQLQAEAQKYINEYDALKKEIEEQRGKLKEVETKIKSVGANNDTVSNNIIDLRNLQDSTLDTASQLENHLSDKKTQDEQTKEPEDFKPATIAETTNDNKSIKALDKQQASLGKVIQSFSLYALAIKGLKKVVSEAVSTITNIDKALIEQAMVTGKTREQTYALLDAYQDLAASTGSTTKEVANLTTQFMRQGKTTEDALTLTQAAMDAAKVAGISATDSVNYLTTALNGFQLSADDAMRVSDKFAAVSATAATSYDEIATALSKVASQANLAGMSIDYTTALLAKGLETTREAPETMGTALKTIIARMREITDYGTTLEGDTDVNNVESQLAYVGIALKDANGELRSTEDVLDDLGRKWDTLNSNQQAAIAKALAGTRQQSRLIAMMSDYERVIELEETTRRSSGATLAQMATYLDGMDAATNRISVAYEKIITNLANNEAIIGFINQFASLLDGIGAILSNSWANAILLVGVGTTILANLTKRVATRKLENQIILQQNATLIKTQIAEKKAAIAQLNIDKAKLEAQHQITIEKRQQAYMDQGKSAEEAKALAITETDLEYSQAKSAIDSQIGIYEAEINNLQTQNVSNSLLLTQNAFNLQGVLANITPIYSSILGIMQLINLAQQLHIAHSRQQQALDEKSLATSQAQAMISGKRMSADVIAAGARDGGLPGAIAGIAMAASIAAALGLTIIGTIGAVQGGLFNTESRADKTTDEINKLSNEIYNLSTTSRILNSAVKSYDELDKQIIKTKEDQKEMNALLDQAADKLTDEQKAIYQSLSSPERRRNYIASIIKQNEEQIRADRLEQIAKVSSLDASERIKLFNPNTTNSDYLNMQGAFYTTAKSYLYDYIDTLDKINDGVEALASNIIDNLAPAEAYAFAKQPQIIQQMTSALNNLSTTYKSLEGKSTGTAAEVLTSDDYGVIEKVKAYNEAISALSGTALTAFKDYYQDIGTLATFSDNALSYIEKMSISSKSINDISDAIQDLGYTSEQSALKIQEIFEKLTDGATFEEAISNILDLTKNTAEYDAVLKSIGDSLGTGVLNMGQNIESLKNQITSFYEKAAEWNTMSDSDKTSFISDNYNLFKGQSGEELLKAIESGDYNAVERALSNNTVLQEKVRQQIEKIETELNIERSRSDEEYNATYIRYLEEQKAALEDVNKFYKASLQTRLEQEQKYLSQYKSYLQDQQDAMKDALDKRREAYQDYFDTVNKEADTKEYEEQENTLITNISKLATSTSADAVNQRANLEQELEDLQNDRMKTLRENAQDAILDNIDDTIDDIDEKFDTLLNSQQALLAAMTGELQNDSTGFISRLIANEVSQEGLTEMGAQSFLQDISNIYGPLLGSDFFKNMSIEKSGDQLILNVAGKEIQLSNSDQQTVYQAIMDALRQIGQRQ